MPPIHLFHDYVNTIARDGITAGCGDGNYCVGASNTREQMAVFLLKSKFGATTSRRPRVGLFSDVPAESPFAPWVEEVAALRSAWAAAEESTARASPSPAARWPSSS